MATSLTLPVHGMTCSGCENAVKRAVATLPGVENVAASHVDHQVTISFDPTLVSAAEIEAKIEKLGYSIQR